MSLCYLGGETPQKSGFDHTEIIEWGRLTTSTGDSAHMLGSGNVQNAEEEPEAESAVCLLYLSCFVFILFVCRLFYG